METICRDFRCEIKNFTGNWNPTNQGRTTKKNRKNGYRRRVPYRNVYGPRDSSDHYNNSCQAALV